MQTDELKQKILELLKAHGTRKYRRRELYGMIKGKKKPDYQVFKKLLASLEEDGQIIRTKGRKVSIPQPTEVLTGEFIAGRSGGGRVRMPDGSVVIVRKSKVGDAVSGDTVKVKVKKHRHFGVSQAGTITRIVERSPKPVIGLFQKRGASSFIIPQDEGYPYHVLVRMGGEAGARNGQLVVCKLLMPTIGFTTPLCEVVEVLGDPDAPGVDVVAIIRRYELPGAFPEEVITESESFPDDIPPDAFDGRRDIRTTVTVTIDPVDAKDFDDAISLERTTDGGFRLGVHIADVSHYVRPGGDMDGEALKRGTSCYLVDRVIPMLPERLSNGLCSLNPRVDRLTKSVFAELAPDGELISAECANTVINSDMRLTYEQVQSYLDGDSGNGAGDITPEIGELLHVLSDLTDIQIARRGERGAIDIDVPEAKVVLDADGRPTDIKKRERLKAHRMVEEAMLLANAEAARALGRAESLLLYRVHGTPDMERLATFGEVAGSFGYTFDSKRADDPFYIQEFLASIQGSKQAHLLNAMLLRSMKKAAYSPENIGHYGLALDEYAHFTSPIRRYPDLVVHRQLDAHVISRSGDGQSGTPEEYKELGEHLTKREIIADNAERDSIKMKAAEFMARFLGERFEGTVSGIMPNGFFVEIDTYFVEGLVHVNTLGDDYYEIDKSGISMTGKRSGHRYMVGDRVLVTVTKTNKQMGEIDFEVVKKLETSTEQA